MATLDEEWLGDCEPNALEKIEAWILNPTLVTAIDAMSSAKGEIKALQIHVKLLSERVDELEQELDNLWEDERLRY